MNSWVLRLIAANTIVYLVMSIAPEFTTALMFVPALVLSRPWTMITYMFLHGGFWHLLFNMLGLYFFGPRVEEEMGSRDFLGLYFVSGLMGALLSFVTPFTAIVGASGAVYGVFLAFAYFWPRDQILLWGIVPVEARWMVVGMTALSLWGGFGGGDNIAHFAHLGGFVGGYAFLRIRTRMTRRAPFDAPKGVPTHTSADVARWKRVDRLRLHEVNREEWDRVMAKLDMHGLSALTRQEREFLDRFGTGE